MLGDVCRELLNKAREWLDEIVDVVDDPVRAVRKQGLAAEGHAKLKTKSQLEAATQFESLPSWYRLRVEEWSRPGRNHADVPRIQAMNRGGRRRKYGVLALVMSALGLSHPFDQPRQMCDLLPEIRSASSPLADSQPRSQLTMTKSKHLS